LHLTPNTKFAFPPPTMTHSHHITPVNAQAKAYMAEVMNDKRMKSVSGSSSCRAENMAKVWETWRVCDVGRTSN
jgi:hypothetical protein